MNKENNIESVDAGFEKQWDFFQGFFINTLIGKQPSHISEEEWHEKKADLAKEYGARLRDLVGKNTNVYNNVMRGQYEKAAQEVIQALHIEKVAA